MVGGSLLYLIRSTLQVGLIATHAQLSAHGSVSACVVGGEDDASTSTSTTRVAGASCVSLDGPGWSLVASNGTEIVSNASTPTDAHGALLAAGIIDDIYFRFNDARYAWVANESWTFRRPLPMSEMLVGTGSDDEPQASSSTGLWTLVCEGLQTIVRVTLDGVELGRANNQYRRWSWPLPSPAKATPAVRTLALEFESVLPLHAQNRGDGCGGGQPQSLRQEYISWGNDGVEDYAQMVPPLPQGPWLNTYLVWSSVASPTIVDVVTQITPAKGMPTVPLSDANNSFVVNATIYLNASHATSGTLRLHGNWSAVGVSSRVSFATAGTQAVSLVLEATNVSLWWPNTYGPQPRYSLTAEFTSDSGTSNTTAPSVRTHRLVGFRTIAFVNRMYTNAGEDAGFTGTPRLFYRVNGLPIFVRGANVVSLDVLESRVTSDRYRNLIQSARAAHYQIFRVNGDANYMKDTFYDLCDELGILIHFEMMFSDCDYSHAVRTSTGFLANVRAEISHQVRRLSHHPSIALWLSNNEITGNTGGTEGCFEKGGRSCYQVLFLDTILDAVVAEDRSRPIWPYSHSDGWAAGVDPETNLRNESEPLVMRDGGSPDSSHEVHQYYFGAHDCDCTADWSALDSPRADGIYPDAAHASEYGWIGAESFDVFRRFSVNSDWNMNSSLLLHSENRIVSQSLLLSRLHYNFPADVSQIDATGEAPFRRVTYLSQLLQALCLRQESEHYRRGRDFSPGVAARPNPGGGLENWRQHPAGTMGTMYWMMNSDYPSPSWGSIDEDGNWRLTHYAMRECYSPVLVSAVVMSLPGRAATPPPPASPTCQTHFDMNAFGTTITQQSAATPADCCAACGMQTQCKAYTWLNQRCYLSNSSGYHHADPRPLVSGLCTNGSCTKETCSACVPGPTTARALVVHIANDHYAANGRNIPIAASSLRLELVRFEDGQSVELSLAANQSVESGSGEVVFSTPVDELLKGTHGFCTSVANCFALATFHKPDAQANSHTTSADVFNLEGGLALLANFKDLRLPTANITVAVAHGNRVILTADAVALYVTVSSSVRGRFDKNGVLLRPGVDATFVFLPWGEEPSKAAFAASLSVQGVNIGKVVPLLSPQ